MMIDAEKISCFTIGHSNYPVDFFVGLLGRHDVNCLADIRSAPYSKYVPQFNKENIAAELKRRNILYVYLGDKLGGIYSDPQYLTADGHTDYGKVRQRPEFREGIESVIRNIKKGLNLALMCAEKYPADCHRFRLVSPALTEQGVGVNHILESGDSVSHQDLEQETLPKNKIDPDQLSLF